MLLLKEKEKQRWKREKILDEDILRYTDAYITGRQNSRVSFRRTTEGEVSTFQAVIKSIDRDKKGKMRSENILCTTGEYITGRAFLSFYFLFFTLSSSP